MNLQASIDVATQKLPDLFSASRPDVTTTEAVKFVAALGEVALVAPPPAQLHAKIERLKDALLSACHALPERARQICDYALLDTLNASVWTAHRKAVQTKSEDDVNATLQYRFLYEERVAGMTLLLEALPETEKSRPKIVELAEKLALLKEDFAAFDEELIWHHSLYGEPLSALRWRFLELDFWLAKSDEWKKRLAEAEPRLKWREKLNKERFKKFLLSRKSPKSKTPLYVVPDVAKPIPESLALAEIERYESDVLNHREPKPLATEGGMTLYAHYAFSCLAQNLPLKALAAFRKNVMLQLQNPDAWLNLGVANFLAGTLHRAKFCFEKANALRADIHAANDLGATLATLGWREKAIALWSKFLKNDVAIEPTYNLATMRIAENNLIEAGKLLQWCGERDKTHGETAFNLAIVMEREAKDFLAERYFALAAKLGVK